MVSPELESLSKFRCQTHLKLNSPDISHLLITRLALSNVSILVFKIELLTATGGILVREFLHLQPNPTSIASLVLLGANHDHMAKLIDWRHPAIWSMAANLDFSTLPSFTDPHTLTPEEWDIYQADIASTKHMAQADLERPHYTAAFETIEAKGHMQRAEKGEPPLLGDSPVAAQSKGFQEIYDAGLKAGNGSPEEQATFGKMVATWKETHERLQNELQALSSCTKVRYWLVSIMCMKMIRNQWWRRCCGF